jgi:hypothetical protein
MAMIDARIIKPITPEVLRCNHCREPLPSIEALIAHKRDVHGVRYPDPEAASLTRSQLRRSWTAKQRIV